MLVSQCRCFMSPNILKLRTEIIAVALRSTKHTVFFFLGFQSATDKNDMKLKKRANDSEELCFFVRSKVNIYCADDGIWSEWSEEECWEGMC